MIGMRLCCEGVHANDSFRRRSRAISFPAVLWSRSSDGVGLSQSTAFHRLDRRRTMSAATHAVREAMTKEAERRGGRCTQVFPSFFGFKTQLRPAARLTSGMQNATSQHGPATPFKQAENSGGSSKSAWQHSTASISFLI